THDSVEVDHTVESTAGPDPRIHGLPLRFALDRVVPSPFERRERSTENRHAVFVGALDDLPQSADDLVRGDSFAGRVSAWDFHGAESDVVDAFQKDHAADAGLGEDVCVEAGQRVLPDEVMEDPIAADA